MPERNNATNIAIVRSIRR